MDLAATRLFKKKKKLTVNVNSIKHRVLMQNMVRNHGFVTFYEKHPQLSKN